MSTVGPELPPHLLAKRKRQQEEEEEEEEEEETPGPAPTSPTRARSSSSSSNECGSKRRRVLGPTLPPAPLSELPSTTPDSQSASSSDEDDGAFGPSLPPPGQTSPTAESRRRDALASEAAAAALAASKKPQREEWMLVPPKQDDWTARVDPTKLRNRKFNTGKGSKAPAPKGGSGDNALWTETPEQKRQRLEDEVMGVKKPAQLGPSDDDRQKGAGAEARETERRIREYNEKNRNTSLYAEHKNAGPKEKEDDPSARAFDKEKDVGLGMKIGHAQKREMLSRAKDFGDRFARGNYL